jgi:hypothetical protein
VGIGNYDIPITGQLAMAGVQLTAEPAGLNPVRDLMIGGGPLDASRDYTVAVHDGFLLILSLANDRLHLGLNLSRVEDSGIEAWVAAAQMLYSTGALNAADYAPGSALRYLLPDLSFDGIDARVETLPSGAVHLTVPVRNVGTEPSPAGAQVLFKAGASNDFVNEGTALENLMTLPGSVPVPPLAPGASAVVEYTWTTPSLQPGTQVVQLELSGHTAFDLIHNNDNLRLYLTRGSGTRFRIRHSATVAGPW